MSRVRRSAGERGSISPIVALLAVAFAALAIGGAMLGHIVATNKEAQRAADAACLAAAIIVREEGLPLDSARQLKAEEIARRNSSLPMHFTWEVGETATAATFECKVAIDAAMSTLIYPSGRTTVHASAKAQVPQNNFDSATRWIPKLVLVLDTTGSMNCPFNDPSCGDGHPTKFEVLRDSVNELFAKDLDIEYGAVFFNTSSHHVVAIGPSAPAAISANMAAITPSGMTSIHKGLNRAAEVLAASGEDHGRYVILLSDGEPTEPEGTEGANLAKAAAAAVWAQNASIFTLAIPYADYDLMAQMSGSPDSHPDSHYAYKALSATTLADEFGSIIAAIVCGIGPIDPPPADIDSIRAYLRTGSGDERVIEKVPLADLGDAVYDDTEVWAYDSGDQKIHVNAKACDAVMDDGDHLVVRYDSPSLTE
jgi:hypothetical protein